MRTKSKRKQRIEVKAEDLHASCILIQRMSREWVFDTCSKSLSQFDSATHLQPCHLSLRTTFALCCRSLKMPHFFWKTWVCVYDMLMMGMWSSEKMGDFHPLRLGPMLLTKTVSWDRKLREAEEVCFWDDIDLDNFPRDLWFLYLAVQDLGSRMK